MLRLRSVRAKLIALVSLTALATLVAVLVLSWVLRRQLLEQADDRVPAAARGFETELEDDLRDLESTARLLATRYQTIAALRAGDAAGARAAAKILHEAHPDIDVLLFDRTGGLVAQLGVKQPPTRAAAVTELAAAPFRGVVEHGCEDPRGEAAPAYVMALPVPDAGLVVACLPLDRKLLRHARAKLGVELAVIEPDKGPRQPTGKLPRGLVGEVPPVASLLRADGRLWAAMRFEPKALVGRKGRYAVVAALDLTAIGAIVRQNLVLAVVILFAAAAAALACGVRIAARMAHALAQVSAGFQRLARHEYVPVEPVRTGDEIEQLADGFNHLVEGLKERDKLRWTLGKYMTQTVMDHLLAGRLQLGGETLTVTILFSDIRSFTTISEKMEAQALVSLLNEYFTAMVAILMEEDGVVDKYIGDAIMAVFGAPVPKPDDTERAVRAAVRMRDGLHALNAALAGRGLPELRAGIGIHTGEVVAGNIGSEARMEYTVIGDAVNLAARLESSTKELGVAILVSEDTYARVRDRVIARPIREITVKGRVGPVMTYEIERMRSPGETMAVASTRP